MTLIDTHTHLYLEEFADDAHGAVRRAVESGVEHLIFPNVGVDSIAPMKQLHEAFPDITSVAMGLHPTEVGADWENSLKLIENELCSATKYVAVGEIGMDLYWDKGFREQQMQAFDRQIALAEQLNLPIIIHCRDAMAETLEVLEGHRGVQCVFHCFGGTANDVADIRRRIGSHPYFGIGGVVTFKNSNLRSLLADIGLEKILLETDSPYLAPVPYRGRRNESSYLPLVAQTIAATLNISADETAAATTASARRLFAL